MATLKQYVQCIIVVLVRRPPSPTLLNIHREYNHHDGACSSVEYDNDDEMR